MTRLMACCAPCLCLLSLSLSLSLSGCEDEGFRCGRPRPGGEAYVCDGFNEACICETGSCARVDTACEGSGFRYLDRPFARSSLTGQCVTQGSFETALAPGATLCPSYADGDGGGESGGGDSGP